jgi:hypothetical protein
MITSIKLSEYLYEFATGENRVELAEREGEREREQQNNREREREREMKHGQKWKWLGLEMTVSEKGYLSIFSKANQ